MSLESNLNLSVFQQNMKRENNRQFAIIMGANFEIENSILLGEHRETLLQ